MNGLLARLSREAVTGMSATVTRPSATPVAQILTAERRLRTLVLWAIYFMGFLTMYFMLSWIPTLFVDAGYTRAQGIEALTGFNLGAIPASWSSRFSPRAYRWCPYFLCFSCQPVPY